MAFHQKNRGQGVLSPLAAARFRKKYGGFFRRFLFYNPFKNIRLQEKDAFSAAVTPGQPNKVPKDFAAMIENISVEGTKPDARKGER